jgi:hypothetical protein
MSVVDEISGPGSYRQPPPRCCSPHARVDRGRFPWPIRADGESLANRGALRVRTRKTRLLLNSGSVLEVRRLIEELRGAGRSGNLLDEVFNRLSDEQTLADPELAESLKQMHRGEYVVSATSLELVDERRGSGYAPRHVGSRPAVTLRRNVRPLHRSSRPTPSAHAPDPGERHAAHHGRASWLPPQKPLRPLIAARTRHLGKDVMEPVRDRQSGQAPSISRQVRNPALTCGYIERSPWHLRARHGRADRLAGNDLQQCQPRTSLPRHVIEHVPGKGESRPMAVCQTCKGKGRCPRCDGSGRTGGMIGGVCPTCRGNKVCPTCNGRGTH